MLRWTIGVAAAAFWWAGLLGVFVAVGPPTTVWLACAAAIAVNVVWLWRCYPYSWRRRR